MHIRITNRELRLLQGEYDRKTRSDSVIQEVDSGESSHRSKRLDTEDGKSILMLPSPPMEEAAADMPLPTFTHLRPTRWPAKPFTKLLAESVDCSTEGCLEEPSAKKEAKCPVRKAWALPSTAATLKRRPAAGFVQPVIVKESADAQSNAVFMKIKEEYIAHQKGKHKYTASRSTMEGMLRAGSSKESCNVSTSTLNSPGEGKGKKPTHGTGQRSQPATGNGKHRKNTGVTDHPQRPMVSGTMGGIKKPQSGGCSRAKPMAQPIRDVQPLRHVGTIANLSAGKRGMRNVLGKIVMN